MAPQAHKDVHLEGVEATEDACKEPHQVWRAPILGAYMGKLE